MDHLSGLPKTILHDILARLPYKDAANTIALSKAWRDTWSSFPNMYVHYKDFVSRYDLPLINNSHRFSEMDILIDYVTKRLLRLRDQGLAIKEFKLNLSYLLDPPHGFSHHVDQWIQIASESGVNVLELYLSNGSFGREYSEGIWYDLPLCVIEAKSLTKLVLAGGIRVDQEFLNHSVKFSSVKMLSLNHVLFTHEGVIENLISHCPLVEYLTVLKKVDVQGIEEVHIDSPELENLCYSHFRLGGSFKLNFDSCRKLRCLCIIDLNSTTIADKWFLELFSKYPLLESLELCNCSMSEKISIFSSQLKVLKLHHCSNLIEVNIDAPNLLSFDYRDYKNPVISFLRGSDKLEVSVFTNLHFRGSYTLRKFIENTPWNILASLSLFIYESLPNYGYLPALLVSSTPPSIKHLNFRAPSVPNREALCGPIISFLLSCCFPKTISFRCGGGYAFIEFFYEMLMGSKKGECYCSTLNRKCWWHALKIVKISYSCSFMIDENADFKAVLVASRKSGGMESITFSLEL
ncbi:hypothetical protein PIB30_048884 [Stylosanthes scabra]|uniref:F-box domain-containing protein n=1 Tax=Stylosanthes scabra TaxID=79078 RepID=A0ABU6RHQ4_9FABA|nr:hypothetical protein [Stylosanthes scabra]